MNNDTPYWYKLISYWVNVRNREGLTIPFIIGSRKPNNIEIETVSELLVDIVNSNLDDAITLFNCNTIGEYVLGLNNPQQQMAGTEIKNPETGRTMLIATTSTQILGNNLQEITESLTKKYDDCLTTKKYSLINRQWADFSPTDKVMIEEALKS
ncbi:MAG: hypothetical protein QM541_05880 [Flavobacterium sp.]|nr:hypothetical protein [Flavobacterium sp.]